MIRKLKNSISKSLLGAAIIGLALGTSAFTNNSQKSAPGDFRFYNKSNIPNNPDHSQYVYRSSEDMCEDEGTVCSEVWNIGTTTAPSDGDLLTNYSSPSYAGQAQPGSYTGE